MIFKETIRAGQSGGRKAAVREELLPSQHPLTKPTRDISASNRSHSITREDPPPTFLSDKRLFFLQRQAEEMEYQKQANIVYTRQFRSLAKLLGNQTMEFDQLKDKIETLVLREVPNHNDPALYQRIQNLEKQLAKRNISAEIIGRSTHSLPTSNQYLRGLQNQLGRKSKIINELSDSIKRETFEQVFRNLETEINLKTNELKQLQQQIQQSRMKSNNNISMLEEELVKHKQTIQKLTFELDTQKRKSQHLSDDIERLKRREKELLSNLQSESKASYQGVTYSTNALLMQLSARDQQLTSTLNQQNYLQQQLYNLKQQQLRSEDLLKKTEEDYRQIYNKFQSTQSQNQRLLQQIEQVTRQLRNSNQAVSSASTNQQLFLAQKERLQQNLQEVLTKMKSVQTTNFSLRQQRNSYISKMTQLQQVVNNLNIHVGQGRNQVSAKDQQLQQMNYQINRLNSELNDKLRALNNQQQIFKTKDKQFFDLKQYIAQRQQEFTHQMDNKSRQFLVQMQAIKINVNSQTHQDALRISQLQTKNQLLQDEIHTYQNKFMLQSKQLKEKQEQFNILQQRIQAFQQQKYALLHRIDQNQKEYYELAQKYRLSEEAIREKYSLENQITSRLQQERQLKILLDQAANKQGQIEAELHQKELQINQIQEQRKRQAALYQQQLSNLTKFAEQLQQQKEHDKHNLEQRLQEQYKIRDQMQAQINTFRQALTSLQQKHKQQLMVQSQLINQTQRNSQQLHQKYEDAHQQKQHLLQQNQQIRKQYQNIRLALNQQNQQINHLHEQMNNMSVNYKKVAAQYQQSKYQLQNEIHELNLIISQLKGQKNQIEKELQNTKKSRQNELASFSFNHFEREHQESPTKLKTIIEDLQQRLQVYQRQEQQRIRLSYSHTLQISPKLMIGSLTSENQLLHTEKQRIQEQLSTYKKELIQRQNQINQLNNHLHQLDQQLFEHKQLLQQRETQLKNIVININEKDSVHIHQRTILAEQFNQQMQHYKEIISFKNQQYQQLQHKYHEEFNKLDQILRERQNQNNILAQQSHDYKQVIQRQQTNHQVQRQKFNQELLYLQQTLQQKQNQFQLLKRQYDNQAQNMYRLTEKMNHIVEELQRVKQSNNSKVEMMELQKSKNQLKKAAQQIIRLQQQRIILSKQLEHLRQQIQLQRENSSLHQRKILQMQQKVLELQQKLRKASRLQFIQPNKLQSNISKKSYVSENHSKSASSELSRRILNDPSKISGQESKFAHNILVFQNSKIHVTRQVPHNQIKNQQRQIKQQRQQESVLSKQIQNKSPQSSHRHINTTHFQRLSNENSRKDLKQSQQMINQSIHSSRKSNNIHQVAQRSHTNSLKSIRQAEEVQEASLPPANNSNIDSNTSKQRETKPKQYLPQQSSKKTIINPNQSKQNVSIDEPQKNSFHRASQQTKIPIYIARASALQPIPQERREVSQSHSGSKTKVRISYGQPSDKSIQLKRRQIHKPFQGSQVSKASKQSFKGPIDNSMNEVSPVHLRNSNIQAQTPAASLFSSQRRENLQSRQSTANNNEGIDHPSQSIINGINQLASRLQTFGNPRASNVQVPKNEPIVRRESSPIYIQPRIATAYSPRHTNVNFNNVRNSTFVPSVYRPNEVVIKNERKEIKKQQLTVPSSKIIMRSVIGGKRNSLLNETATFGKNSIKQGENQAYSQSNDSGIDILQMDWMTPCCKNQ